MTSQSKKERDKLGGKQFLSTNLSLFKEISEQKRKAEANLLLGEKYKTGNRLTKLTRCG
jgi:hypothetical protein